MFSIDKYLVCRKAPWILRRETDQTYRMMPAVCLGIENCRSDGVASVDRHSSMYRWTTTHEEEQPYHLPRTDQDADRNHRPKYDLPGQRACPAGTYEAVGGTEEERVRLQVNAQNCLLG